MATVLDVRRERLGANGLAKARDKMKKDFAAITLAISLMTACTLTSMAIWTLIYA